MTLVIAPQDAGPKSALGEVHVQAAATSLHSGGCSRVASGNSNLCGGSGASNMLLEDESDGMTMPTFETSFVALDVEDGVKVISTPQESVVGITFATPEAAKDYYNSYAHHAGFYIRIDTSRESKRTKEKTKYIFVCQRARVNKKRESCY
ncbi:unnamed protein product [Urochloa humidicola]